jgi:transcription antitermination factor NusG
LNLVIADRSRLSSDSSIAAPLLVSPHKFGLRLDDVEEGRVRSDRQELTPERFTASENPFLFPQGLLCGLTHLLRCGDSWRVDEVSQHSEPATPIDSSTVDDYPADRSRWWLVHSKPRQEKKLANQLRSLNVPHYLPVTKCKAITRGRTRVTRSPQFPGYLFLWMDSAERRAALETNRIVATHYVANQTGLSRQLWELADLIEKGVPLRIEERLAAGQQVRVKAGLLKDKQGMIIKRGGKTRLFVFVSELLGGVSLEIDQHLLEPC